MGHSSYLIFTPSRGWGLSFSFTKSICNCLAISCLWWDITPLTLESFFFVKVFNFWKFLCNKRRNFLYLLMRRRILKLLILDGNIYLLVPKKALEDFYTPHRAIFYLPFYEIIFRQVLAHAQKVIIMLTSSACC